MLHNILETKLLLPKVKASLASERLFVCNQGLTCKLSNIMLYETLLVSDIYLQEGRQGNNNTNEYSTITLFSSSSLKRKLIIRKGHFFQSLRNLRRVVRIHCIFDTNAKMQILSNNEVAFGSLSLDPHVSEQRVLVFENMDFKTVDKPFTSMYKDIGDSAWLQEMMVAIDNEDALGNIYQEEYLIKGDTTPNLLKKHSRSLSKKRQELIRESGQQDSVKFNMDYVMGSLQK